ncbi:PREDICTED: 28S ribosomal protein S29, mitochondrial-like isoform X2 [Amphimedon queenslandica]|uniref:Small ribosomal subunit protein mS29 n=1 Tax=Amphimedon queenslandica TaxID=400682 RepID=A0AAN0JLL6_AMPQE|nr:PREDICTED: 28S ribosomal protein S29, mitochondrial-like isoform X2 [Amphimedon queenslandica]|eukprot:XP_019857710.1 PREDICTED: 28S ribosomal protein S29, mitochondrial-like isoform X2 [Amphimedon queenslandica]
MTATNYCTATEPKFDISVDQLGTIYSVGYSDLKKYSLHNHLPTTLKKKVEAVGKVSWLLRDPSWYVLYHLKNKSGKRFLFYGPDDCGKSVCLLQIIHYCLANDWIVLHVPSVFKWTHSSRELKPLLQTDGLYDLPDDTVDWLSQFKEMNHQHISELKLSQDYTWNNKETVKAGESLLDIIKLGIAKPKVSHNVFHTIFNEISVLNKQSVLLAVDDINGCYCPTSFKQVEPEHLCIVKTLREFLQPNKFKGVVVGSVSRRLLKNMRTKGTRYTGMVSGRKGRYLLESFDPVKVMPFSAGEFNTYINNLNKENWMNKELNKLMEDELWTLSGGVPGELEKICRYI